MQLSAIAYLVEHKWQIVRFGMVGIATFLLNLLLFRILFGFLGFDYRIAVSIAYAVTVCCHFLLNRYFTFNAEQHEFGMHVGRYGVMLAANYGITLAVMWTFVEIFRVSPYLGVIASTAATASSSFFMMKHFVFRQAESA